MRSQNKIPEWPSNCCTLCKRLLFKRLVIYIAALFFFLLLVGCYIYISYQPFISDNHRESVAKETTAVLHTNNTNKTFQIFYWTEAFEGQYWFGLGFDPYKTCTYSNCFGVADLSEYNTSDAVLFHMRFLKPFPKYRFPHQKWVMHIKESPLNEPDYTTYNGRFNATWTYHRKSDVKTNYSRNVFIKNAHENLNRTAFTNYAKGRDKLVAWFVSNCNARSRRQNYVRHLQEIIKVDIYGGCGPLKCSRSYHDECLNMLRKHYKFYLSFENSICEDYMTKKLWHAYLSNVVPVVLGGYNYSEFLPPMSYIDIKDYDSPQALADHLLLLDKNDDLYNKYFEWKQHYQIVQQLPPIQCTLCEYLNKAVNITKVYDRLDLFWNKETDCHSPETYYSNIDKKFWN